jgi:TetR/AcrR family transcriptional repressor of nem operon
MGRKKTYDRAETAERALHAFWENGYQQTSLRDLEVATGVNRYGLYDSFTDKEGLFRECIEQYATQAQAMLDELSAQGMDGLLAKIGRFVTAAEDDQSCRHGCLIVSSLLEREHFSTEIRERLDQHIVALLACIRGVLGAEQKVGRLRGDLALEECVEFIHLLFVGLPTMSRLSSDRSGMQLAAKAAVRTLESWRC